MDTFLQPSPILYKDANVDRVEFLAKDARQAEQVQQAEQRVQTPLGRRVDVVAASSF